MSEIVATVNGQRINRFDYDNALQAYAMELHRKTLEQLSEAELAGIRDLAMEKLLARELIFQQALASGVVATEAQVEEEKGKIMENFPSEEEFYATLAKAGIDSAAYHRMLRQDLTVNLMTEKTLSGVPQCSDAEVELTYDEHREKMVKPPQVRAAHILVKVEGEDREGALRRIGELKSRAAEEDFGTLAREHSVCPSRNCGGDLGYFKRGDMVKPFSEAAFSQDVGVVGEIVESPFGFHLIKVLDRTEGQPMSLEEATPQIRAMLRDQAGALALKEWVAQLKDEADIKILL